MRHVHSVLVGAAVLAAAVGLLLAGSCSRKEEEAAPAPRVVKVPLPQAAAAPAPQQGAPGEQAARPAAGGAASGGGKNGVGEHVLSAPGDYLYTVTVTAPRHARTSLYESTMTETIQQYRAMNGKYPPSLAALAQWCEEPLPTPPSGFKPVYDPSTGTISLAPADR